MGPQRVVRGAEGRGTARGRIVPSIGAVFAGAQARVPEPLQALVTTRLVLRCGNCRKLNSAFVPVID